MGVWFGPAGRGGGPRGEHGEGIECFRGGESERNPGQEPDLDVGGFGRSLAKAAVTKEGATNSQAVAQGKWALPCKEPKAAAEHYRQHNQAATGQQWQVPGAPSPRATADNRAIRVGASSQRAVRRYIRGSGGYLLI